MLIVGGVGRPVRSIAKLATATVTLSGALVVGCHATDRVFCGSLGCDWTDTEWSRVQSLSPLPAPPPDTSNVYYNSPAAAALGQAFYFDTRFSGLSTLVDSIGRPVAAARTAKGSPANVSCASCHDPSRAGTDESSVPNTVSIGAGIYDVNSQQTLVAAYFPLLYWNGRSDSLWSQAIAVNESGVSMNGTRLQVFWTVVNDYYDRYQGVFEDPTSGLPAPAYPLPPAASITSAEFPLQGKPGSMKGCQAGSTTEPFGDAWDCLGTGDQSTVNQVFVNFGKAIAAYEYAIASQGNSPFDRFVHDGPGSGWISPQAENGARLFVGKASCIDCHNTPLFSDGRFHNIGVPQTGDHVPTVEDCPAGSSACNCAPGMEAASCLPSGVWGGTLKLAENAFRRGNANASWSDDPNEPEPCATTQIAVAVPTPPPDAGLGAVCAPDPTMKGAWRTPSLRDVALTAPYMHDGTYTTLSQVVQHYNMGGVASAATAFQLPLCGAADAGTACMEPGAPAPHLSVQIKPLDLTDDEVADLVAFLETLNDAPLPASLAQPLPPLPPDAGTPHDAGATRDANDGSPSQ